MSRRKDDPRVPESLRKGLPEVKRSANIYRRDVPTAKPRRVTGGIRSGAEPTEGPNLWAAQRWMRIIESAVEAGKANPEQLAEGLEYARLGQTRTMTIGAGAIDARVQGRMPRAYRVQVRIPTFAAPQWERVIGAMLGQARYVARLLAGELPANIEDVFIPEGLRLFPSQPQDVAVSCTCDVEGPWCKHACCIMKLISNRLINEPFLVFQLRGMPQEDLLERVRAHRAAAGAGAGGGSTPIFTPHLPGVADRQSPKLDECVESFFAAGPGLEEIDLSVQPPEVSHPLLRRLGPSPFDRAKFPLVGLLATCYEVVGQAALEGSAEDEEGE